MNLIEDNTTFTKVSDIAIPSVFYNRMRTGVEEFDMIFGDGILPGSSATMTAQAGCGKTTLLLQLLEALTSQDYSTGYASGEENTYQLAYTCNRLNVKSVKIANETDIDTLAAAMINLDILVIDSFQALTSKKDLNTRELERYAVSTLCKRAKESECALIFVMHLTQAGKLKGSTLIPHSVDVNIQINHDPESEDDSSRIISTYKNRFGATVDIEASIGSAGFTLTGKKVVEKAKSKNSRKKELYDNILKLDPPTINKPNIMKLFSLTGSQAYLALKELVDRGDLVKYGRGATAVFKKSI